MLRRRAAYFYFQSACYFLMIWAMTHVIIHFAFERPINTTEARLFEFMTQYEKPFAGGKMTAMDIQNGLNICYALFLFFIGFLNLWLFKKISSTYLLESIAVITAVPFLGGAIVSLIYFFWIPVILFSAVALCYAVAWWKLRSDNL